MNPLKAEGETDEHEVAVDEADCIKERDYAYAQRESNIEDQVDYEVEEMGHISSNISWVTADGNRAQGHLTLGEVRALFTRIANNYKEKGYLS